MHNKNPKENFISCRTDVSWNNDSLIYGCMIKMRSKFNLASEVVNFPFSMYSFLSSTVSFSFSFLLIRCCCAANGLGLACVCEWVWCGGVFKQPWPDWMLALEFEIPPNPSHTYHHPYYRLHPPFNENVCTHCWNTVRKVVPPPLLLPAFRAAPLPPEFAFFLLVLSAPHSPASHRPGLILSSPFGLGSFSYPSFGTTRTSSPPTPTPTPPLSTPQPHHRSAIFSFCRMPGSFGRAQKLKLPLYVPFISTQIEYQQQIQ